MVVCWHGACVWFSTDMVQFSENSSAALGAKCAYLGHRSEQCGILMGGSWLLSGRLPALMKLKQRQDYSFTKTCPAWGLKGPIYLFSRQVEGREQSSDIPDVHFKQRCFSTLQEGGGGRQQDSQDVCEAPQPARPRRGPHCSPQYTCTRPRGPQQARPQLCFHS